MTEVRESDLISDEESEEEEDFKMEMPELNDLLSQFEDGDDAINRKKQKKEEKVVKKKKINSPGRKKEQVVEQDDNQDDNDIDIL
jgi:hypothetical protein